MLLHTVSLLGYLLRFPPLQKNYLCVCLCRWSCLWLGVKCQPQKPATARSRDHESRTKRCRADRRGHRRSRNKGRRTSAQRARPRGATSTTTRSLSLRHGSQPSASARIVLRSRSQLGLIGIGVPRQKRETRSSYTAEGAPPRHPTPSAALGIRACSKLF